MFLAVWFGYLHSLYWRRCTSTWSTCQQQQRVNLSVFLGTFSSLLVTFFPHCFFLSLCAHISLLSPCSCCLLSFNLLLLFSASLSSSRFLSISQYLSGSCRPPNVLEGSQVGSHCWLHVYFYPTAKRLLITVDKFRYVSLSFSTVAVCYLLLQISQGEVAQVHLILCPNLHFLWVEFMDFNLLSYWEDMQQDWSVKLTSCEISTQSH